MSQQRTELELKDGDCWEIANGHNEDHGQLNDAHRRKSRLQQWLCEKFGPFVRVEGCWSRAIKCRYESVLAAIMQIQQEIPSNLWGGPWNTRAVHGNHLGTMRKHGQDADLCRVLPNIGPYFKPRRERHSMA